MDENRATILANSVPQPIVVELPKPKLMKSIKSFNEGMLPPLEIAKFTNEVNALINSYNLISDSEANKNNRIAILEQIQEKIKAIDYKFKPDSIAGSKEYLEVCANLFIDMQQHYASMGRTMLKTPNSNGSLAELIANMHPDVAESFATILVKSRTFRLNDALEPLLDKYQDSKETQASILALKEFMKNYEISYLGGGNSRNFLVTKNDTQEKEVLKVDFRLDMPKSVEAHLRTKIVESFTAIRAERQVAVTVKGETTGRTLLVTEYCSKGNLQDYSKKLDDLSPNQRIKHIGTIFQQMSLAMLNIQSASCLFADGKICNWLVDSNLKLRIADTKSFVFVDAKGVYSPTVPGNEECGFLTTKKFSPPEHAQKIRNADSTHAFLLGINLYVFLSGAQPPNKENGMPYDYNHAIFQSPEGQHLKTLISALVQNDPQKRLSLKEADQQLFLLANPELRVMFAALKQLKIGEKDVLMDAFIRDKQQQINNAPNQDEREKIIKEINTTIAALKTNEAFNGAKNIIGTLRAEAQKFYNYGKGAKADKIESALLEVPIGERVQFEKSTHASVQKVMEGLASKRTVGGVREVTLTGAKEIDLQNAAGTFKSFKDKFKAATAVPVAAATTSKEIMPEEFNRPRPGG